MSILVGKGAFFKFFYLMSTALVVAVDKRGDTYRGWVVDQLCAVKGRGADGVDLKTSPQNHTVGYARMPTAQKKLFDKSTHPEMPEGYYSGDKPNPNLQRFVEEHQKEHPYDPASDVNDIGPLHLSLKSNRSTKIFNMPTYWSKKPHSGVRDFVTHYTIPGDLVLNPYCSSGGSILVATMTGRNGVYIDLSPAATFLSSTLWAPLPRQEFDQAFQAIMASLRRDYARKGESCCPSCGEVIRTTQEKFGYQLDEWHLYVRQGTHHTVSVDGKRSPFEDDVLARIREELTRPPPVESQFSPSRQISSSMCSWTPFTC